MHGGVARMELEATNVLSLKGPGAALSTCATRPLGVTLPLTFPGAPAQHVRPSPALGDPAAFSDDRPAVEHAPHTGFRA